LEDYAKAVAKLEGASEQQVKVRIQTRAQEIFKEVIEKQKKQIDGVGLEDNP
jgi:hypothetical protein